MIVGEYQCRCIEFQGSSDDHPGIDAGAVYSAPEEPLKGYQAVLTVQEDAAEELVLLRGYMKLTELLDVRGRGEGLGCS